MARPSTAEVRSALPSQRPGPIPDAQNDQCDATMVDGTSVEDLDQILSIYQEQVAFPDLFDLIGIAPGWVAEGSGIGDY